MRNFWLLITGTFAVIALYRLMFADDVTYATWFSFYTNMVGFVIWLYCVKPPMSSTIEE